MGTHLVFKTETKHLNDANESIKAVGEPARYFGDDELAPAAAKT